MQIQHNLLQAQARWHQVRTFRFEFIVYILRLVCHRQPSTSKFGSAKNVRMRLVTKKHFSEGTRSDHVCMCVECFSCDFAFRMAIESDTFMCHPNEAKMHCPNVCRADEGEKRGVHDWLWGVEQSGEIYAIYVLSLARARFSRVCASLSWLADFGCAAVSRMR